MSPEEKETAQKFIDTLAKLYTEDAWSDEAIRCIENALSPQDLGNVRTSSRGRNERSWKLNWAGGRKNRRQSSRS